ncbi:hypothetical protein [Kineosporia sp. R_H_3]|uniref:hypothetical protein n=1 Tax=Kineosporia sp. R_H_3 TaxID=1961848 RepID=UPI00117BB0B4|nr:hypothetical protein [Kineosporia sp. R_H_3]
MTDCRAVRLAALLRAGGALFEVVGGTARHLAGDPRAPRDLDVAVRPDDVEALAGALGRVGAALDPARARRLRVVRVDTSYGPLDVFVGAA